MNQQIQQNQQIQDPVVNLELPLSAVSMVMTGLNELPRKFSHGVCDEIERQVQFQLAAAQAKAEQAQHEYAGAPAGGESSKAS